MGRKAPSVKIPPSLFRLFRARLLAWWRLHGRQFPWRQISDPYRVLIAEILLRRTRATQVLRVFTRFLEEFPDPPALARAHPERIRRLLWPLGLHWRTGDVIRLGRAIAERSGGTVPSDPDTLRSLPGVGDYVTAAVRCFALGERVAVVDVNTARVVSRFFGIDSGGEPRRNRQIIGLLERLVDPRYPREFNWALIDLAALVCGPRMPACSRCPLNRACRRKGVERWV